MRVILQRVKRAEVRVDGATVGHIGPGLLLLVGLGRGDGEDELRWMARKIAGLRLFAGEGGGFDRSLVDMGYEVLAVSQFTLYGDCRKGRRPSFNGALGPEEAKPLMARFLEILAEEKINRVESGRFGAMMEVDLVNDGPVTLTLVREAGGGSQ